MSDEFLFYFRSNSAPRPRPITTSVGIGTRDFGAAVSDAETQGGPPPFELSSFLQDLFLTAASSPYQRAPVTVLYSNFRQFLDAGLSALSPPPADVTLCQGTSTRDEVEDVDVATDTGRVFSDKAVLAVVDCFDAVTAYDPPVETVPAALLPVHVIPSRLKLTSFHLVSVLLPVPCLLLIRQMTSQSRWLVGGAVCF